MNLKLEELNLPLCKCGCGYRVTYNMRKSKANIYLKGHHNRKYNFDIDVWNEIKTEEDAYWLGFFCADGFVKDRGSFGFHLGILDLKHLEHFRCFMGSNHPIDKKDRFCRLEIEDKLYLNTLKEYGFVQGKSDKMIMPMQVPFVLKRHFIRGVFDGDGWITQDKRNGTLMFGVMGSICLILDIQEHLIEQCDLNFTKLHVDKRHKKENIVSLCYGGNRQVTRIFDELYTDSTVFLERKYEKWIDLMPTLVT